MRDLLVIVAVGLGTYTLRAVFMVRRDPTVPRAAERMLQQVAPAALAAIVVPALLLPAGAFDVAETGPAVLAAAAAAFVWVRRRAFAPALLAGLATWWVVLAVLARV